MIVSLVPMIPPGAEPRVFEARLTPQHSLDARGRTIVLGGVGTASFLVSLPFLAIGAWPVAGFFGLDVFLLWLAFRTITRRGREYEEIFVSRVSLLLRRVTAAGAARETAFNPFWVRLQTSARGESGIDRLHLVEGARRAEIGGFLNGGEKAEFSRALVLALHEARRGPPLK